MVSSEEPGRCDSPRLMRTWMTCACACVGVQAFSRADKNHDNKITFAEYQDYCLTNPEVQSWMAHFDDAQEDSVVGTTKEDSELELEAKVRALAVCRGVVSLLVSTTSLPLPLSVESRGPGAFVAPPPLSPLSLQIRVRSANQEAANDPEKGFNFTIDDTVREQSVSACQWQAWLLTFALLVWLCCMAAGRRVVATSSWLLSRG